jgi:light-regulated signal transduction histidine kinase (bacteriophytochrome)
MSRAGIAGAAAAGAVAVAAGWGLHGPLAAADAALAAGALLLGGAGAAWLAGRARGRADEAAARAREALRGQLSEARRELDDIHYSVSHDLRSPIGAALNFLTVLEEDAGSRLDSDGRAILARVRRSVEAALSLLDGLARLSRAGRKPLTLRSVDVEALVREEFARLRPPDRLVELRVAEPVPAASGDPELLRTAFAELLSNAIKFSVTREKATVRFTGRRAADGTLEYEVADDGVGFDPRFAHKLFRVFERLHAREEFPGAGAGLAVVRRVAERHGGTVHAEAEPEQGARFSLRLPPAGEEPR